MNRKEENEEDRRKMPTWLRYVTYLLAGGFFMLAMRACQKRAAENPELKGFAPYYVEQLYGPGLRSYEPTVYTVSLEGDNIKLSAEGDSANPLLRGFVHNRWTLTRVFDPRTRKGYWVSGYHKEGMEKGTFTLTPVSNDGFEIRYFRADGSFQTEGVLTPRE